MHRGREAGMVFLLNLFENIVDFTGVQSNV